MNSRYRPTLRMAGMALIMGTLSSTAAAQASFSDETSVSRSYELVERNDALLIDVRTPMEWRQTGVAAGAHLITLQDEDFLEQVSNLTGGDKKTPVAFICRSGNRSAKARDRLQAAGYSNVTSVAGGMSGENGWLEEDLPTDNAPMP